ncbi:hypothetical protein LTR64_008076 [Lithohypha guttulata]|uniref:uncharacterized protein n=1 Tax=Lithohypha guttulata TaxID=1690604 RepID=UPI00315C708A
MATIVESAYVRQAGTVQQDMSWVVAVRGCTRFDIRVRHKEINATHFGDQTDVPGDTRITGGDECSYTPAQYILPLKTENLPLGCSTLPRFAARQIRVDDHDPRRGVYGKVPIPEGGNMYFKPREEAREKEFDRELSILNDIKKKCLAKGEIKLPDLQGIVVSGDVEETCIGMLMNVIPTSSFGIDLTRPECWAQGELHKKWEQQVIATVEVLHTHDIIWGDVNAGNIVIDEALNAWVIDFGGRNNPEFVDDDKAETIEGDWQGVERLFYVWLPNRRADIPW